MTAPTHYNGKPIPPGTWLTNAARVAAVEGEAEESVTAPTHPSALAADLHASQRLHEETREMLDQALTDRDDARRELAEQKRVNASNLRVMTEQLELARQMLADAPHAESCVANVWTDDEQPFDARPCDCWKAGL
jgi:hypothetical protein